MPWEIFRSTSILPDTDRSVTLITKAGGLFGYVSHIVLAPEYDLGFTFLVAGDSKALQWLDNEVITTVLKEVEQISRKRVSEKYSGVYTSLTLNSSVALDVDGPSGLTVKSWISNGTDFLAEYTRLETGERDTSQSKVQLVPAKTYGSAQGELWRATVVPTDRKPKGIIDTCMINDVNSFEYGERSLQDFEFIFSKADTASAVILPALRINLQKMQAAASSSRGLGLWTTLQRYLPGKRPLVLDDL